MQSAQVSLNSYQVPPMFRSEPEQLPVSGFPKPVVRPFDGRHDLGDALPDAVQIRASAADPYRQGTARSRN
jgi:hypothetical protein